MVNKSADAFRTISEVAEWLGVQTHVLRFWESKFSQVKPVKRAGGRRYYRPADMLLLGGIRKLLHEDGMTIKGVQKILREEGMAHVADMSPPLDDVTAAQVDGDLVIGDGAVEAEMAPAVEDTPEAAPVVQMRAPAESEEPETADMFDAPQPEDADSAEMKMPGVYIKEEDAFPDSVVEVGDAEAPSEPDPLEAPDTDDAGDAPSEPVVDDVPVEDDAPVEAEVENETEEVPVAAREDAAALPGFLRNPLRITPEDAPEPPKDEVEAKLSGLPSFMSQPPSAEAVVEEDVPAAPKPRVVDVPDTPDTDTMPAKPSALTLAAQLSSLDPAQREAIAPLVAQLTALRDRMASARREPR